MQYIVQFEESNNKGVVEVDKRIDHLFQIKQEQVEFVLITVLIESQIMCPMSYKKTKNLALYIEAEIDDESIDKKKSDTNILDNSNTEIEKSKIKRKNVPKIRAKKDNKAFIINITKNDVDHGSGTKKDDRKALINYQIHVNIKHVNKMYNIGNCNQDRIYVEKHKYKAFINCQKSTDMSHTNDKCKAFNFFQKSVDMSYIKRTCYKSKEIRKEEAAEIIKGESEDENKIEINNIIKIGDPKKMIEVIWINDVDNSINIISILLNTYLRRTVKQSIEAGKYMKRIEGGTRTLEINSE
ncbi:hypothetical protein F8M41_024287 [Gigaspora margarita]|uniref:Uncharacterized protein n=1 Tax=Gigaspora margarita TaxID=4874 RepID=A0A8H4ABW3_GIGMA|nr:hypothetical protein F8M41_024287 [Gigaspora margarita]